MFGSRVESLFVGCGLIGWWLAVVPSVRHAGIGVVVAIFLHTMAAVTLVVAKALPCNDSGLTFALASAVYTLLFAQLQYLGRLRIESSR